jgi:hypothetical protein
MGLGLLTLIVVSRGRVKMVVNQEPRLAVLKGNAEVALRELGAEIGFGFATTFKLGGMGTYSRFEALRKIQELVEIIKDIK